MFEYYNKDGPIYIIQSKKTGKKYQLHKETDQVISIKDILDKIKNDEFTDWVVIYLCFNDNKTVVNYDKDYKHYIDKIVNNYTDKIKSLNIDGIFNELLGNSLSKFINLENLYLGYCYNKPFKNYLSKLVNLKNIHLSDRFNRPLEDSLLELPKFEKIYMSHNYIYKRCMNPKFNNIVEYY